MVSTNLNKIQEMVHLLSYREQLLLIEYLANNLRSVDIPDKPYPELHLAEMSRDNEIQCELKQINREFSVAEADGLENI